MNEKLLEQYARLVVEVGLNLQKGQKMVLRAPVECAPFARLCVRAAYAAGASDVIVQWRDDVCSRERWLHGADELFDSVYPWDVQRDETLSLEGAGYLSISATDPENLRGVSPERLRRWDVAVGRDQAAFYRRMMASAFPWCVVSVPVPSWARRVFPELAEDAAVERLWGEIFAAVRIAEGKDAVAEWREHCARLARRAETLTKYQFRTLHYTNSLGTDLTVGLPEGHIWGAGDELAGTGVRFVANMPTEEVFTAPKRDEVSGELYASMPLALNGNLVKDIHFNFENGRIVAAHASEGEEVLRAAIDTDEGAHYLGEAALVPFDSPIRESGLLFYNTLFDENASCHFAFGEAYPTCIEGGTELSEQELLARGVNAVSSTHVDFMVGTRDLRIVGTTRDGAEVEIFRDGNFTF